MFGELPAYGFYLRHIDNISFKNVKMTLEHSDYRPAVVADDVVKRVMENVVPDNKVYE